MANTERIKLTKGYLDKSLNIQLGSEQKEVIKQILENQALAEQLKERIKDYKRKQEKTENYFEVVMENKQLKEELIKITNNQTKIALECVTLKEELERVSDKLGNELQVMTIENAQLKEDGNDASLKVGKGNIKH